MVQFDWLIALGPVSWERLMMRFDWFIALGLVWCEWLMERFDWLIASAASSLSLSLSFVCAQVSQAGAAAIGLVAPFFLRSCQSKEEREREWGGGGCYCSCLLLLLDWAQQLQSCRFRELSHKAISKFWHLPNLKLPNKFYLAANLP